MVAETLADQSDRQLVEQFLAGRGEAVFEAVVRRHGAMVYRVCWRVLQHHQDAEDAFQATFLVLAQRLRTVRKRASLASWLHGVAHRVALKARAEAGTRRRHEAQASVRQTMPPDDVSWGEVRAVLDAELAALPEKWRLPLVLCYMEGRTQNEAAAQLGWTTRTLRRRLEEGRAALGRRLRRRGVVWPAALSAVLLSDCAASAGLSAGLVGATVEAGACVAAGEVATTAAVSAKVAALTNGMLQTMLLSKIKVAMAVVLVVVGVGIGGNRLIVPTWVAASEKTSEERKPKANQAGRIRPKVDIGLSNTQLVSPANAKSKWVPVPNGQLAPWVPILDGKDEPPLKNILVPLRPPADTTLPLDRVVKRLGLAGELAKINAVNVRHLREEAIRIVKQRIESQVKELSNTKEERSVREALQRLEESVQMLKELLTFDPSRKKR